MNVRSSVHIMLSALLGFAVVSFASAQPALQDIQKQREQIQKELDEIQRELDRLLNQDFPRRGLPPAFTSDSNWGGVRLVKVDKATQEKLGLPENEGLLVNAVTPNSAADKAGLKQNDVLVKINNKTVPGDLESFAKLVKDQKPNEAMELGIVRNGKEETLKEAMMPALVQTGAGSRRPLRPGLGAFAMPRIDFNARFQVDPLLNGARIVRSQKDNDFTGEYSKGDLKISVTGKLENGVARTSEITVQEGKEVKKYTALKDVPIQHRPALQQIMPSANANLMMFPAFPNFRDFPALPIIPGIDD